MWRLTVLVLIAATATGQPLEKAVRERIAQLPATVTLYAKNLDTGATLGIRESEPVRTASTIKLAIMMAVFDAVEHGKAKFEEPLTIAPREKVSGSGVLGTEFSDNVQIPLRDAMHLMIVLSDNTATNLVLERISADAVNAYLDRIGIKTTRSMRKILGAGPAQGVSAAGKIPENARFGIGKSSPADMVAMLEKIERGEAVTADASKEMIKVLKRNQDNTGITRRLNGTPAAHKTGALDALRADVGVVYAKTGRIAMAIYVDGIAKPDWSPDNPGSVLIADVAKMLVDGLGAH
ncbi:MAG TPA: serine hydrolase [Bryobacteraceae bacterium]|jgi:beta-lactamase class A|nr:serine hydrolase [Bryobacteraceae bacterium]